jgi:hypothetical protein
MFGRGEYSQWFPTVRFTDKRFSTTVKSAKKTVISPECLSVFVPCDFIVQAFPFSFNFLAAEKLFTFKFNLPQKCRHSFRKARMHVFSSASLYRAAIFLQIFFSAARSGNFLQQKICQKQDLFGMHKSLIKQCRQAAHFRAFHSILFSYTYVPT